MCKVLGFRVWILDNYYDIWTILFVCNFSHSLTRLLCLLRINFHFLLALDLVEAM